MKWLWSGLLTLVLMLPAQTAPARSLKACGHPFYPPVSWHSQGELTGMAAAVTRQLFAELGYRVELTAHTNWKRCLQEVKDGNTDIIVAAFRTDQRARWLSFTQTPIITDTITLFVRRHTTSNPPASAWATPLPPSAVEGPATLTPLKQRTVGLLLGDSFGDPFDRYVNAHSTIEYVSRGQQNFAKLALGRIDLMPLGRLSGHLQGIKLGYASRIQALPDTIATEHYYLALGQHSGLQHHLPWLNQRLAQLQRNGTLDTLVHKYSLQYLNQP